MEVLTFRGFGADLHFQVACSSLQVEQVLLEVGLLSLESGNLILQIIVFIFLIQIGVLHVFFSSEDIVCQLLSNVLGLSRDLVIEALLFGPKVFDFLVVEVKFFLQCFDSDFKPIDLTLERCRECSGCHVLVCVTLAVK